MRPPLALSALLLALLVAALAAGCTLLPQYRVPDASLPDDAGLDTARRDATTADARPDAPADRAPFAPRDAPDPCRGEARVIELPREALPHYELDDRFDQVPGPTLTRCTSNGIGTARGYELRVTESTGLRVTQRELAEPGQAFVSLRRECALPGSEFACAPITSNLRAILPPGRYSLLVATMLTPGSPPLGTRFSLELEAFTPAPNALCASATRATAGAPFAREVSLYTGGPPMPACDPAAPALNLASLYYAVTVPPGARVTATAAPRSGSGAESVMIRSGCDDARCLAYSTRGARSGGGVPRAFFDNREARPREVLVEVRGFPLVSNTFDLSIELAPTPAAPPDAACATARFLAEDDATLLGESFAAVPVRPAQVCGLTLYQQRYYRVSVPPRWRAIARARASDITAWRPRVVALPECEGACLTVDDPGARISATSPSIAVFYNDDPVAARAVTFAVGSEEVTDDATYDLSVAVQPPAANATCPGATPLTDGATLPAEDPLRGDVATLCPVAGAPRTTLYYSATVPAQHALVLAARAYEPPLRTAATTWHVADACDVRACAPAASDVSSDRATAVLVWPNRTDAPRGVVLARLWQSGAPPFSLRAEMVPRPAHRACEQARPIADGAALGGELVAAGDAPALCGLPVEWPRLFYRVTVDPRQTLDVIATSQGSLTVRMALYEGCPVGVMTACPRAHSATSTPGRALLTYTNAGTGPLDAILVVTAPPGAARADLRVALTSRAL